MKTAVWQLECALANFLNYRRNIIIPNIGWGLHIHEFKPSDSCKVGKNQQSEQTIDDGHKKKLVYYQLLTPAEKIDFETLTVRH